jgi:hypothetical protein
VSQADRLARFPDPRHRRGAARARRYRQRHRNDRAIVTVEIDIEPVTAYLVDCELLQVGQVEDRQANGTAIRDLIESLPDDASDQQCVERYRLAPATHKARTTRRPICKSVRRRIRGHVAKLPEQWRSTYRI